MSRDLTLIGKTKFVYESQTYFRLFFSVKLDPKTGEGVMPYSRAFVGFGGIVKKDYAISCTEEFYNTLEVGEVLDEDSLVFNAKNKLVGCFD